MEEDPIDYINDIDFEIFIDHYWDEQNICVYTIDLDNKKYVGITHDTKTRWRQHAYPSSKCRYIRNALLKYGVDNAKFEIIERDVSPEDADEREQYHINRLNTLTPNGYNLTSGGRYHRHSEETKQLMREWWQVCENRERRAASLKEAMDTAEYKEKRQKNMLSRWQDEEYRESIKNTMIAEWANEEHRKKRTQSLIIANTKPEAKERVSKQMTQRWEDDNYRDKMTTLAKNLWADPDHRDMRISSLLEAHARPEEQERKSKASKAAWDDPIKREKILAGWQKRRIEKQKTFEDVFMKFNGDKDKVKTELNITSEKTYRTHLNAIPMEMCVNFVFKNIYSV
ncbi:GIY-YIG catalytic domain-containing endonuclease [Paramecium bursaria Chlorella virus OR0704.2.2]|nr:GIY-YIG catalytic domain-containing endonuclease [Paramecium bursaria Chlorella virus OR0704.2.2]